MCFAICIYYLFHYSHTILLGDETFTRWITQKLGGVHCLFCRSRGMRCPPDSRSTDTCLSPDNAPHRTGPFNSSHSQLITQWTCYQSTHQFVPVFALDFSKAFDGIRRNQLYGKLSALSIPDEIYNWIIYFLTERGVGTLPNLEVTCQIPPKSLPASFRSVDLIRPHTSSPQVICDQVTMVMSSSNTLMIPSWLCLLLIATLALESCSESKSGLTIIISNSIY